MKKSIRALLPLFLAIGLLLSACSAESSCSLDSIPDYSGSAYVNVNDNQPYFSDTDLTTTSFETYSELDSLGRCGVAWSEELSAAPANHLALWSGGSFAIRSWNWLLPLTFDGSKSSCTILNTEMM